MRSLLRHKAFIRDMRKVHLTDTQAGKFFLYVATLLKGEPLPPEAMDHALHGEWRDFRELHQGGNTLLIYKADDHHVFLTRLGSHTQLFKKV